MKVSKTDKWSISLDGERFEGVFDTRDDAAASVSAGYVGRICKVEFDGDDFQWDASYELSECLFEVVGDVAELWNFTRMDEFELMQAMRKTMVKFLNENNLQPKVYKVIDIEYIDSEDRHDKRTVK